MTNQEAVSTKGAKQPRTGVLKRVKTWLAGYRDENPQSYVAAKRAAGIVLIADALFGLENPLDGRRTRPGIWGRVMVIVPVLMFAIIWFFAVGAMGSAASGSSIFQRYDAATEGTVVSVEQLSSTEEQSLLTEEQSSSSTTSSACNVRYKFLPDGAAEPREGGPGFFSSSFCVLSPGDSVTVEYDPDQPWRSTLPDIFGGGSDGPDTGNLLSLFRLVPIVFLLPLAGQFLGILVDIAQIVIGSVLLRSASKDAKRLLSDGFDISGLVEEMRGQLIPLVMTVKSGMKGAARMFRGGFPTNPTTSSSQSSSSPSPSSRSWSAPSRSSAPSSSPQDTSSLEEDMAEYEEFRRWRKSRDRDA